MRAVAQINKVIKCPACPRAREHNYLLCCTYMLEVQHLF